MSEENKDLESLRKVLANTLAAMGRHKDKIKELEGRLSAVELTANGAIERLENLEKAIQLLIQGAPDKLQDFLSKAVEPGDEAEAPASGSGEDEEEVAAKVG